MFRVLRSGMKVFIDDCMIMGKNKRLINIVDEDGNITRTRVKQNISRKNYHDSQGRYPYRIQQTYDQGSIGELGYLKEQNQAFVREKVNWKRPDGTGYTTTETNIVGLKPMQNDNGIQMPELVLVG